MEALSIETRDDVATPLLPYGTRLPTTFSDIFSTAEDGQQSFQLNLLVGNSAKASENRTLVRIVHPLRRPGPRGLPRIQVTVVVEENGDLVVRALEDGTKNSLVSSVFRIAVASDAPPQ